MRTWVGSALIGAVVLTVAQLASGSVVLRGMPSAPGWLPWSLAANLLVSLVMGRLAVGSPTAPLKRALLLLAVLYGIQANNLVEGLVFLTGVPIYRLLAHSLLVAMVFVAFLAWWTPGLATAEVEPAGARRGVLGWAGRVLFCDVLYLLIYITAGLLISPRIASFYASRPMPAPGTVVLLQLLLRGPVLIAIVLLAARMVGGGRLQGALWSGLTLSIIGGVAPLIIPNPYLPDVVRFPHLAEVGLSNLAFGAFTGWFLGRSGTATDGAAEAVPAAV